MSVHAQVIPEGPHTPSVITTQNGLPQINIRAPSPAGVSINTYTQFDVQNPGVILNNSPTIIQTQQAGLINGNPNFGPGQSARIIINQVNSRAASQINGHVEVAGPRAEVVIANGSGISVNGGGFINTSRAILTTGTPNLAPDGSLAGFNVTGGNITVQGAGFNASDVDQVDLISRAVQANAAIYAKDLNVITGTNSVDHGTLNATPIAGNGPAPGVSIDVSNLGGMYANRIVLVGTEHGVGVSSHGVLAAQAGDLILTTQGRLVLAGQTNASGNMTASARDGIDNSGTTWSQQSVSLGTAADLTNSGTLAAQQDLNASAGSVNSTGTLGAGISRDGSITRSGNLGVSATGSLSATGRNAAGGDASLSGASMSLAGGRTSANGNLALAAGCGDLNLSGATTTAGGALSATAQGTLTNDGGALSSHGAQTIAAGAVSNVGGQIVSDATLDINVGGALDNRQGVMQAAGRESVAAASLDNAGGQIASLNGDGLSVSVSGVLNNGAHGVLGGNGDVTMQAGQLVNAGSLSAAGNLTAAVVQSIVNSGRIAATGNSTLSAGTTLANSGSITAGQTATASAATLDNSAGELAATRVALSGTNLINRSGTITQVGSDAMQVAVSGTLDNSTGTLQTNSTDLTLAPATLINDGGTILHAGTGTFTLAPGNGSGFLSNVDGSVIGNGALVLSAGSVDSTGGLIAAQKRLSAAIAGVFDNTRGQFYSASSLALQGAGVLVNAGGWINAGQNGSTSTLDLDVASLDNADGRISNTGTGAMTVSGGTIVNSHAGGVAGMGTITGNGDTALTAGTLVNTQGAQLSGANLAIRTDTLANDGGQIGNVAGVEGDIAISAGTVSNAHGQIGSTRDLTVSAGTLSGGGAHSAARDLTLSLKGDFSATSAWQFSAGNSLTFTLPGTFSNSGDLLGLNSFLINAGDIINSGTLAAGGLLATRSATLMNTGAMVGGSVSLAATSTLSNLGPTALIGATDSNGTLELLAPDIENRDDTTATDTQAQTAIYGLGKVVLAGGKDASGNYVNAGVIRNQSALIGAAGDMLLAADLVTNTRRVMTTGYTTDVDPALLESLGISLSGCTAIHMAACSGQNVGWVTAGDPTLIGGAYIEPPHGGQWNSGYQYTTYTGVAEANTVTSISPQAQIIAGGNLSASSVGLFQNYWSAVAAAGDIALPATLDQNSWQGQTAPQLKVTYSGQYHYNNYDNSEHDWQLPFGDAPFVGSRPGGYTQKAPADIRYYALPGYESSFVAGGTLGGTGVNIDNAAGNASLPPLGLLPGQGLSGPSSRDPVTGASGPVDPVIGRATAGNVLNNLTVPQGGLFRPNAALGATYLIETNPAFTNARSFLSSDYYLQQLDLNPQTTAKRLGDGFYEQQLVRNQITALTGKALLGPYTDLEAMYEALLASGAGLAKSLDLPLGIGLSAEQVAQLTSNVIIMETRIVDGQAVLVPVVYLAQASQQNQANLANGPVIAATDIDIRNAQSFVNSGTVSASNSFSFDGQSIDSRFGALQSGANMTLKTAGDVDLTSASVKAGSLQLQTGGNLILDTAVTTRTQVSDSGATRTMTTLGPQAQIDVAGDAAIVTGGNFELNAGALSVGGNLGMLVGGDWTLGAQSTGEHKVVERANGVSDTDLNQATGSVVKVGGVSAIAVGGDLSARGAQIELGGGGTVAVNGNVSLLTASATSTVNSSSSGNDNGHSYAETLHRKDETLTGTTLTGGDNLAVVSGGNINVMGSAVSLDRGNLTLAAVGDVNVGAVTETHELNAHEMHSHSGVASGTQVASGIDQSATYSYGSTVSADGVTVASGRDINVVGSNIVATNDVLLKAARDVNVTTSQDSVDTATYYDKKETGLLSNGGLSVSVGSRSQSDQQQSGQVTNNGSMVGSLDGNVTLIAGNDLHATGSILHAANDLTLAGKTVTVDAAYDTANFAEQQQFRQAGVTVGVTSPVVSAVQTGRQMASATQHVGGDARLTALAAATTGLAAKNAYDVVSGDPVKAATSVGINVSVGASKSDSQLQMQSSAAAGSSLSAGRNVTIAASGAGADSNINVIGSNVSAGNNVLLATDGNVNLQAAQNTSSQHSENSGASAGLGVSIGVGSQNGIAFTASAAANRGHADGDSTSWTNTHVTAGNGLTIVSGGDTNLKGAVVSGQQVIANVGGNLNIESPQDTDHYDSKQQGAGLGVNVCVPPLCAGQSSVSASVSQAKMNSDYAGVTEQSGIQAGDGGFQVNVKGNTDLKGGVIASSDQAVADGVNSLTTGTLTYSDIHNHASYDASQVALSGGYGGDIGKSQKGTADNVNPVPGTTLPKGDGGLAVAPPVALGASGDASSTTRSGISGGAITITDEAKQQQLTGQSAAEVVAGVNRDTSDTAGVLAPIYDKEKIQAGFDITSQFVNEAGTFVANRAEEADAAKKAANDPNLTPEQRAAAQATADDLAKWGPGGSYRQVLTALTVAAGGNVTGGMAQFAQGATVVYLQELGAGQVKQIADRLGSEEARAALHAIVGCSGAAASSQSCGAGAMGAAASSVLGSLLKPAEGLSAAEREARDNLVTSLVAGIAAVSGVNAVTAAGAAKVEVENNQVAAPMAPVPGWLAGFKLPWYTGESRGKGDGVIADNATELDPTIKPGGSLIYPMPSPGKVSDWITAIIPDQVKGLVDYITTAAGGNGDGSTSSDKPAIDTGKQGKHQPDHNNFILGRSELTYPDPQKLVDNYAGSGQPANNVAPGQPGYRERVNFGTVIGDYVDPVTGEKTPTTNGIIHYSKDGVHIVPGRP